MKIAKAIGNSCLVEHSLRKYSKYRHSISKCMAIQNEKRKTFLTESKLKEE